MIIAVWHVALFSRISCKLLREVEEHQEALGYKRAREVFLPGRHVGQTGENDFFPLGLSPCNGKYYEPQPGLSYHTRPAETKFDSRKDQDDRNQFADNAPPACSRNLSKRGDLRKYQSVMAFDIMGKLPKVPDLNQAAVVEESFEPLSIFDIVKGFQIPPIEAINPLSLQFDEILQDGLKSVSPKFMREEFNPILAHMSVSISKSMARKFLKTWNFACSGLLKYQVDTTADNVSVFSSLYLPFIYQFLSQKPSPQEWLNLERIWLKFFCFWKIQLIIVTQNSELKEDLKSRQARVLEITGKCAMWISELLLQMYCPEFLNKFRERVKVARKGMNFRYAQRSALARVFEYIILKDDYILDINHKVMRNSYSTLLKYWQVDCNAGYPLHEPRSTQKDSHLFQFTDLGHKQSKGSSLAWENWKSDSYQITFHSKLVTEALNRPLWAPVLESMSGIEDNENKQKSLTISTKSEGTLKELESLHRLTCDTSQKRLLENAFEMIPNPKVISLPIPPHIEMFDYFLDYRHTSIGFEFLPDKVQSFFKIKSKFGPEWPFWKEFELKQKECMRSAKSKAKRRQEKYGSNPNPKRCNFRVV